MSQPQGPDEELERFLKSFQASVPDWTDRLMIFIDWAYVVACVRDIPGETRVVDVGKFASVLARGRRVIRTYLYDGKIENTPTEAWKTRQAAQQRLEAALAYVPSIELRWGRVQYSAGQFRQKGVDVLLSLDMLRFALKNNYDRAILVSGDGDFADIVKMVKDEGRTVEVAMFASSKARSLVQAADVLVDLNADMLDACWRE